MMTFRQRDRRQFSRKVRVIAFQRAKGHCQGCGAPLVTGRIVYDHIVPWELSRDSSVDNCRVTCDVCDSPKTARDQSVIAKSNRQRDKHIGAFPRSRNPLPGGRRSPFKFKVGGGIVDRQTGAPWRGYRRQS